MSKIVRVNGDYKIGVSSGGTITFDTGWQTGNLVVTGNLTVYGTQTTVSSENVAIKDNIIVVNDGETGAGVTLTTAGIEVDRGSLPNAAFYFDESVSFYNPVTALNVAGTFVFKNESGTLLGIITNSINTNNTKLAINTGTNYITVIGTTDYERQVLDYSAWDTLSGPIALTSDVDAIPSTQAMVDYVTSKLYFGSSTGIIEGNTSITAYDSSAGHSPSRLSFVVDGTEKGKFTSSGLIVDTVNITSNTVTSTSANGSIVITPTGTGTAQISTTTALKVPVGNEAAKGVFSNETGQIRYNTTSGQFEGYYSSSWSSLGGGTSVTTTSVNDMVQTSVYTYPLATYRTAELLVQIVDSTNSYYHATKIVLTHDGATVYMAEYGVIFSNSELGTFDADISGSAVRLRFTASASTVKTVKVYPVVIPV